MPLHTKTARKNQFRGNANACHRIIGLMITAAIGLVIVVIAVALLCGRGSFLIAGYNTLSKETKAAYDTKSLCRFVGKLLFPIGALLPQVAIGDIYRIGWLSAAYGIGVFALIVFALIYF